ncbi:MAG TPA: glycine betaine ABC transporter substrate-binding protein [Candidatus Acidoferrales bacterium]|nr:glycine betaine ABC transporter substrate-binding protein [Candidatus Acidoferrales bacterium]
MDRKKIIAGLIAAALIGGCSRRGNQAPVAIGSKNFTEQVLLGEIVAQHLERRLHTAVDRRLNLGGTLLAHEALVKGEIDLYPEYTGTALAAILKDASRATDSAAVLVRVRAEYLRRFQVRWLDPLGIDNGFAMVVRGGDARARHLETLSDAARAAEEWRLGAGYEFEQRADGLAALRNTYHLRFLSAPVSMDLGLLYQALQQKQVDMIAANATDGLLSKLDLKVLADDRHAFPPYQVCIAARLDKLHAVPGLEAALNELSGRLDNSKMQELNYRVDGQHTPVPQVAAEFLKQAGL